MPFLIPLLFSQGAAEQGGHNDFAWTIHGVAEIGGRSSPVNRHLMRIPLEKFESYLVELSGCDFAFVKAATWEEDHMMATLFPWISFGDSLGQHQTCSLDRKTFL